MIDILKVQVVVVVMSDNREISYICMQLTWSDDTIVSELVSNGRWRSSNDSTWIADSGPDGVSDCSSFL